MIDLKLLRDDPKTVSRLIKKRDPEFDINKLIKLDSEVREVMGYAEMLRGEKNKLAKVSGGGVTEDLRERSMAIGKKIKETDVELGRLQAEFKDLHLRCPNIPQEDIPEGGKENNQPVKTVGEKPTFSFEPKNHVDLYTKLGQIDFDAAAKMTGSNFALYQGEAVSLVYGLAMLCLKNNVKHGYSPILPPYMVNEKSLVAASNFPKFRDQVYEIKGEELFMTPTAEVNLTNLYRDSIISGEQLPMRMTAWTSCFRSEAGAYGATERGLIRIHQFEKAELYTICKPENSDQELDRMIACAEDILKALDLHYRISLLAAEDCSFASSKTFDIEVWLPGQKAYYEVSSCSNCTDFQARRGMIRYKDGDDKRSRYVNTLNGSSLALPRLMVALAEVYQQEDGTIQFPDALKKEMPF